MRECDDRLVNAAVRLLHDPHPTTRELEAVAHLLGAAATSNLLERLSTVAGKSVQERVTVCRAVHAAICDHTTSQWRRFLTRIRRQRGLT